MSNELQVKYKWQEQELTLTKSDVKRFIATSPNVTDQEIQDFMWLCQYKNLNPFIKEAYLIKYGQERANIVTSKDVFDARADADPRYDGEEVTNNYKRGMNLMDLWVRTKIFRKGCAHPVSDVTVHYPEYVGRKKDGTINRMWQTKPVTMLTKVSKAQGKREANPKDMAGLYLTEEFDQQTKPTETDIREIDITPKNKDVVKEVVKGIEKQIIEGAKASKDEVNRDDEAIDEIEVLEQEQAEAMEVEEVEEEAELDFEPASDKQKVFIYGTAKSKGIVSSHLITEKEVERIGKAENLSKEKASKILAWWWGDKDKNIVGEREKREKNPKIGNSDFERRGVLMQEVLDLMKENHIKKAEASKMYKKYQKDEIIKLAFEELEELKVLLENYVPNWK